MVQHALACPHFNLVTCPNFRAARKIVSRFERAQREQAADEKVVPRVLRSGEGRRSVTRTYDPPPLDTMKSGRDLPRERLSPIAAVISA